MNELYARLPLLYFADPSLSLARSLSSCQFCSRTFCLFYQWFKGNVHRIDAVFGWFCHKNQYVLCTDDLYTFFDFFLFVRSFQCFNILSNRFFIGHIRKANNVSGEWTTESDDESCAGIFLSFSFYKYIDWYVIHRAHNVHTYIVLHTNKQTNALQNMDLSSFCCFVGHTIFMRTWRFSFFFFAFALNVYRWGDRLRLMSSINTCFYVFWHVFLFLLFKVVAVNFFVYFNFYRSDCCV